MVDINRFQSTHPARGATTAVGTSLYNLGISIHAPREGCDSSLYAGISITLSISIHAPREGCDRGAGGRADLDGQFQSTHPARGATRPVMVSIQADAISIHAPREGCDASMSARCAQMGISIHAPREGCDFEDSDTIQTAKLFQSTHPARGATIPELSYSLETMISIHAPREGCDHADVV